MNNLAPHPAFEQLRTAKIESLDIDVQEFVHKKTRTPHIHLAADNPENVFLVGLRTIPTDSTGVAHILEHTVLCGSEKYPVRDPFFMMIRRSLNTFMNAFTSSDWTAYPFASQNRKDYFNLLDVYLDAVFFSRLDELDFMQEGHRVEFEEPNNPDSDLVFKGVVFNEMKGAMSAPNSILWNVLGKHLFPNNTYHHNSGGDPEAIPDLSHQALVDFYKTHYHPSNAVLMTFGDIPAAELQQRFDEHALSRFEPLDRVIKVNPAHRIHSPIRVEEAYAAEETADEDKSHVLLGWLLGKSSNLDERLQMHLLSSVLLDNSASPLMQALEKTDLGNSPSAMCGVEDSNLEMVFVCGMNGTKPENSQAIEDLILSVLEDVAKNGVDKEQIDAVLHQLELSQREIGGDGMPFGLTLLLSGLSPTMQYADPLAALDLDPALQRLNKAAQEPNFISNLVQRFLLDNNHRVRLTLRPDGEISERRVLAEKQRLASLKSSLTDNQVKDIIEKTKALAERQAQVDDPGILPKVTLADVPETMHITTGTQSKINGAPAMNYAAGTNGLVYQQVVLDLPELDAELQPLLPLYTSFTSELGSNGRDYIETQALQASVTGGISAFVSRRSARENEQDVTSYLMLRGKALLRNSNALAALLHDTLTSVRFDEKNRIRELIAQTRASSEQSVTGRGHSLAMAAAASGMAPTARLSHELSGLVGIKAIKQLDDLVNDDSQLDALCEKLAAISDAINASPTQFMVVAEQDHIATVETDMAAYFDMQSDQNFAPSKPAPVREKVTELWTTNTEVNFCSKAFPTVSSAHEDAAALTVLGPFLGNGFLHRAIRETGGAYGGGGMYDADSASFRFYSYRDPRSTETLHDFSQSIDWLINTKHETNALEEAILNVISNIDRPASPAGEARSAYQSQLFGRTPELRQAFRQQILGVGLNDLQRVAETYFQPEQASMAIITNTANANNDELTQLMPNIYQL